MKRRIVLGILIAVWCGIGAFGATVPRVMGQWPGIPAAEVQSLDGAGNLNVLGNTLFADSAIIDITDIAKMRRVGTLRTEMMSFRTAGPYLLEFGGPYIPTLRLLDVTERANPTEIARVDGVFIAAAAAWPYVYAAANDDVNLKVYDFTNPRQPVAIGTTNADGGWAALSVEGDRLAGLDIRSGTLGTLWFFDISDRTKPVRRGSYDGVYFASAVVMRGNFVFIGQPDKLEILDISDPANPTKIGEWSEDSLSFGSQLIDVAAVGDYLWVSVTNEGITILDVSDPTQPQSVGFVPGTAHAVHTQRGNDLFFADYNGVTVFDVTNPVSPTVKGNFVTADYFGNLLLTSNKVILNSWYDRSALLDVTNPARPSEVAQFPASYSSEFVGDKLFLMDTAGVIHLYDATNLERAQELSQLSIGPSAFNMVSDGQRLYVGDSNLVKVVNFSNPQAMQVENSIELPAFGYRMARTGARLAVTSDYVNSYLTIIDISDPTHPTISATVTNNGYYGDVVASGNAVYVHNDNTIRLWDITDAANPVPRGLIDVPGARGIGIGGQKLVALLSEGISSFDISDPFAPKPLVSIVDLPLNMARVTVSGDVAYIAAGTSGLITVQLAGDPPTQPFLNVIDEGEMHRVRWTADFAGYTLFSAPTVTGPWTPQATFNDTKLFNEATAPNHAEPRFYKLQK